MVVTRGGEHADAESSMASSMKTGSPWLLLLTFLVGWWWWDTPWLFPLRMLVVAAHEASHALAAVVTGGQVVEVGLDWREGGHTLTRGGWRLGVLNAGYLGSLAWGVLLLVLTRGRGATRGLCLLLGLALVAMGLFWVRPWLGFGFFYTVLAGAALGAIGVYASHEAARFLLRGVGAFSVLYGFLDIREDVFLSPGVSDAALLSVTTGIPAIFWGGAWCATGLVTIWAFRRHLT
jgi:hypothetical protein